MATSQPMIPLDFKEVSSLSIPLDNEDQIILDAIPDDEDVDNTNTATALSKSSQSLTMQGGKRKLDQIQSFTPLVSLGLFQPFNTDTTSTSMERDNKPRR